ncbi:MAG: hypothetical protein REI78_13565 [Pedobacter sp.]|nr:hypothetical protein [Pedobacter sp.]MDQ8054056.1 hypothetical protein [Pedobacter sp.]
MKIKLELTCIGLLWLNILISYVAVPSFELPYVLAIIGMGIATGLYLRYLDICLVFLLILLLFGIFGSIRFGLAYNIYVGLYIGSFNLLPLLLFIILIIKRKQHLKIIFEKWTD